MKFKVGSKEFEITDSELSKALENKTTILDLAVTDIIVRTTDEDNRFVENMKKDARKESIEIAVKKTRESLGLTFEGKTIENLVTAVKEQASKEAGLEPDKKLSELTIKLKDKDTALSAALLRASEAENDAKKFKSESRIDKLLDLAIPENTVLPKDDIKMILKSKLSVRETENGTFEVYDQNGVVIKNKSTSDALPVKDVIEDFFRDNTHYLKTGGAGGGGKDSSKSSDGTQTIEEFNTSMKEKGYEINSTEYTSEMNKAIEAKTINLED